jgi:hypothetical protein
LRPTKLSKLNKRKETPNEKGTRSPPATVRRMRSLPSRTIVWGLWWRLLRSPSGGVYSWSCCRGSLWTTLALQSTTGWMGVEAFAAAPSCSWRIQMATVSCKYMLLAASYCLGGV